jgi:hypothetical protein
VCGSNETFVIVSEGLFQCGGCDYVAAVENVAGVD